MRRAIASSSTISLNGEGWRNRGELSPARGPGQAEGAPGGTAVADAPAETAGPLLASGARALSGDGDLLEALEAMKPLVASMGAEKVKRLVDLLG